MKLNGELIKDTADHPKGIVYIKDKRKKLRLTEQDGAIEKNIIDKEFFETEDFNNRFHLFMEKVLSRNNKRLKRDSVRYRQVRRVIIGIYARVLVRILLDQLLKGNRILFYNSFMSMHITQLPTHRKLGNVPYKYFRKLRGIYPVIRVAISPIILFPRAIKKRVHHRVMRIDAFYTPLMSGMISHKIEKERMIFSKEWYTILKKQK